MLLVYTFYSRKLVNSELKNMLLSILQISQNVYCHDPSHYLKCH